MKEKAEEGKSHAFHGDMNDEILEVEHNHIPHGRDNMSVVKGPTQCGSGVLLAHCVTVTNTTIGFCVAIVFSLYFTKLMIPQINCIRLHNGRREK